MKPARLLAGIFAAVVMPLLAVAPALTITACRSASADDERWLTPTPAPQIAATDVRSETATKLSDLHGHVVMLAFGYTGCSDICPTTLATMRAVFQRLRDEADSVAAVYVSVDPARDKPPAFRQFLESFDARISGWFVQADELPAVIKAYGVVATKRAPNLRRYVGRDIDVNTDYSMDHTTGMWLIDTNGQLRVRVAQAAGADQIAGAISKLLHD